MQTVQCPHCAMQVRNDGSLAGHVVSCPRCHQPFQMPSPPPAASGNAIFDDIGDESSTRRRRRQQPSYTGLWVIAVVTLLGMGFAGLWLSGVIQFKAPPNASEQQAKKATANDPTGKWQPENSRPKTLPGKQISTQLGDQDKKAKELAEAARKKAAEEIQRQNEINRLLAELDQQAKKDIAEIDQRLVSYRRLAAIWEQKAAALRQNPRFGDPFNPGMNAAMKALNHESQALQGDLRSINRLIEQKQSAFNSRRDGILRQFPDVKLPSWANYYGESR